MFATEQTRLLKRAGKDCLNNRSIMILCFSYTRLFGFKAKKF